MNKSLLYLIAGRGGGGGGRRPLLQVNRDRTYIDKMAIQKGEEEIQNLNRANQESEEQSESRKFKNVELLYIELYFCFPTNLYIFL